MTNGARTVSVTGTTTGELVACEDERVILPLYVPGDSPAGLKVMASVTGALHVSLACPSIVIQAPPVCSDADALPNIGAPELLWIDRPIVAGPVP
jgi:hypothetical protein